MSILDEIKALDEKKKQLLSRAKKEALANAASAVADLNSLGYSYRLVQSGGEPGTRRTGIRSEVLGTIRKSPNGINRADLLVTLGAKGDKRAEQSISNALAALKKSNAVTVDNGNYKVAS
jgi:hypothetical protein